jgi:hypothetical protein
MGRVPCPTICGHKTGGIDNNVRNCLAAYPLVPLKDKAAAESYITGHQIPDLVNKIKTIPEAVEAMAVTSNVFYVQIRYRRGFLFIPQRVIYYLLDNNGDIIDSPIRCAGENCFMYGPCPVSP